MVMQNFDGNIPGKIVKPELAHDRVVWQVLGLVALKMQVMLPAS
jgi:hypothetical protein